MLFMPNGVHGRNKEVVLRRRSENLLIVASFVHHLCLVMVRDAEKHQTQSVLPLIRPPARLAIQIIFPYSSPDGNFSPLLPGLHLFLCPFSSFFSLSISSLSLSSSLPPPPSVGPAPALGHGWTGAFPQSHSQLHPRLHHRCGGLWHHQWVRALAGPEQGSLYDLRGACHRAAAALPFAASTSRVAAWQIASESLCPWADLIMNVIAATKQWFWGFALT